MVVGGVVVHHALINCGCKLGLVVDLVILEVCNGKALRLDGIPEIVEGRAEL